MQRPALCFGVVSGRADGREHAFRIFFLADGGEHAFAHRYLIPAEVNARQSAFRAEKVQYLTPVSDRLAHGFHALEQEGVFLRAVLLLQKAAYVFYLFVGYRRDDHGSSRQSGNSSASGKTPRGGTVPHTLKRAYGRKLFFIYFFKLAFACSQMAANDAASFTAISASIFLLSSMPAFFSPNISLL